jgi:ribose transport system ATP-binding protein
MSRLVVAGVKKRFGATLALDGVELHAEAGEVHAVLGENGAGKSTLMKILAGALRLDSGRILLDARPFDVRGPIAARDAGVAMVYQEPLLCPHLSVEDNVLLGVEPVATGVFVDRREARRRTDAALALVEAPGESRRLEPTTLVGKLSPSERQLVALARALAQAECRVLILDEPTSSLPADDAERLFEVVGGLKRRGICILYISHFLEEVERIADRYTVLRDGQSVASGTMGDTTLDRLVELMAGRRVEQVFTRSERTPGEPIVRIEELAGERLPRAATLTLHRGEVLGIAGLLGSGRTELLRAVFGLDEVRSGKVRVGAFVGPASPARRLAEGVGMLSEDRKQEGLAESLSLTDNLTLSRLDGLGPFGVVLPRRAQAVTRSFIERLRIRCRDPEQPARDLSGGNQQKLALARLLYHDVDVYLLDEPTRGIDVASRADVYGVIDALAARGKAVLLVSSYLPELLGVCDRVAVMRRGRLGPVHAASDVTEHGLLVEATGAAG